jgi:hypothetical protein
MHKAPEESPTPNFTAGGSKGFMLLMLLPLLWLFGLVDSFFQAVLEPQPYQTSGKRYFRLGRYHRASDGETIRLRCARGSSGNKPKVVDIHRRTFTWRYTLCTIPARTVLLLLLIAFFGVTSTTAMQSFSSIGSGLSSTALTANLIPVLPMPSFNPTQALLMGLTEQFDHSFRPFTAHI